MSALRTTRTDERSPLSTWIHVSQTIRVNQQWKLAPYNNEEAFLILFINDAVYGQNGWYLSAPDSKEDNFGNRAHIDRADVATGNTMWQLVPQNGGCNFLIRLYQEDVFQPI